MGDSLRIKRRWLAAASCLALLALIGTFVVAAPQRAQALSGAEFNPGYIISDTAFYDSNAMTEAEIQSFLVSKKSGLSTYRSSTESRSRLVSDSTGNVRCEAFTGGHDLLASTLIFRAQKACGISAKVILVTLEKEQGLIRNPTPSSGALSRAMGFACPDTAPCAEYALGFGNQIYMGALQLKTYKAAKFARQPGVHSIQFYPTNPKRDCGATNVNVRNYATAALYNYTPYQPNESALANLRGSGDECASYGNRNFWVFFNDWFGSPVAEPSPIGSVDVVAAVPGNLHVGGWALDPETKDPIDVHVYVNNVLAGGFLANNPRPDVDAAYGGVGALHGFDLTIPNRGAGAQDVCVYGINQGLGANVLIGCRTVIAKTGPPVASLDVVAAVPGQINVGGWIFDPDTLDPVYVHVYVNNVLAGGFLANNPRPDVDAVYGGVGALHGFGVNVPNRGAGVQDVCVYGINQGFGANVLIGCRTVMAKTGSPVGILDSVSVAPGTITVSGWTFDPDTAASTPVHIYVGSVGTAFQADTSRPDVAKVYGYGDRHGFSATLAATPGTHQVCAYGIDVVAPGAPTLLGCRTITAMSGSPVGMIDSIGAHSGAITVAGWVWDPDTTAPISVRVEVDGAATTYTANQSRPDVGAVYPAYGSAHGYVQTIAAPAGTHKVCIFGLNTGPGQDQLLGCKSVVS